MPFELVEISPQDLRSLRMQYRAENPLQIIHDSLHTRHGWTKTWGFLDAGEIVGYGSLAVAGPWTDKPTLFELFVQPSCLDRACKYFERFRELVQPVQIETQSNIPLLSTLAFANCRELRSESLLFEDRIATAWEIPDAVLRPSVESDRDLISARDLDENAGFLMEVRGEVVGSGGYLTHYNPPYADLYMTVVDDQRQKGFGKWIVQELKRQVRNQSLIPAARCRVANTPSSRTLQAAGFVPCGILFCGIF